IRIEEIPLEQYAETVDYEIMRKVNSDLSIAEVAQIIWLCGIVLMGGCFIFSNLHLMYRLKRTRTLLKNSGNLPVYLSNSVDTPCLFGLFRPAIYLTSEAASDKTVASHATEHELTHYRHRDHIWAILRCVCLAVHWYNPLVWCAAILSRNDAELACDEATIQRLGEDERAAYGRTLIGLTCEKHTALLNTATTMTGSGESIKERITLIARKPQMAVYTLVAVVLIAVIAVGCTFTGAKEQTDSSNQQPEDTETISPSPSDEETKLFTDMETYVRHRIEKKKTVSYYSIAAQNQVTVNALDAKIAWLEKRGEVSGLASNGILEAWSYNILVKPDADTEDIMLVGGQYEENGYFDLEGQGGHITVALRSTDGSYDVLYDAVINDGLDFFGYCNTTEEAIHDWYVKAYDLDLPLYATDWIDRITVPESGSLGNIPVHRFDGNGWYLYVPVQAWNCPTDATESPCTFTSAYYTGSTLKVDYFDYTPEGLSDDHRKQGFTLIDEANQIWSRSSGGVSTRYYCFTAQNGGCWRITIEWIDENISDSPYTTMEPEILQLMAESFTVDAQLQQSLDMEMQSILSNLTSEWQRRFDRNEEPISFLRVDDDRKCALTVDGNMLSVLSAPAKNLQKTDTFRAFPGSIDIVFDSTHNLSFWAGVDPFYVHIRYDDGTNMIEGATVYDPQLYLYHIASAERENVQLADLDQDGFLEAILWQYSDSDLIIYDYYENEIHRIDVNHSIDCEASNYTGLIANIQPAYNKMVQGQSADGTVSIYRYENGTFTYECPISSSLQSIHDADNHPAQNAAAQSFISSMGCNNLNCTDSAHFHECGKDCNDPAHYHFCNADCNLSEHNHPKAHHKNHH
ncbi:MAG: M56 family metallopeptidase, partial [Oscillospiraceae bacterium]|nr:M56 family metallopeptidase [Oscillospiraceae bacterium]